jgi:hypothetical protein
VLAGLIVIMVLPVKKEGQERVLRARQLRANSF